MSVVRKKLGFLVFGALVSGAALYLALRDLEWKALAATLGGVDGAWLAACCTLLALGILLRGWRWSLLAHVPGMSPLRYARAVNLGLLGNQLLPGRVGELVRIFALMRLLPTGMGTALGSAVLDRAIDVIMLLLSAWALTAMLARSVVPGRWLALLSVSLFLLVAALAVVRSRGFSRWMGAMSERWLHRWAMRPETFLPTFDAMWHRLLQPAAGLRLAVVAAALLAIDYMTVAAAIASVGLNLPLEAPLLLWVALAASSALPSAPGYVGIYQLAAVWSLGSYAVAAHQAVAVAFVLQGLTLAVSIAGSAPELARLMPHGTQGER